MGGAGGLLVYAPPPPPPAAPGAMREALSGWEGKRRGHEQLDGSKCNMMVENSERRSRNPSSKAISRVSQKRPSAVDSAEVI
jgi:hypothetical protein